jgi:hypothetical protein
MEDYCFKEEGAKEEVVDRGERRVVNYAFLGG